MTSTGHATAPSFYGLKSPELAPDNTPSFAIY